MFPEYVTNILRQRYLREGETPEDMFARVSRYISLIDYIYLPEVYDKDKLDGRFENKIPPVENFAAKDFLLTTFELHMLYRAYVRNMARIKVPFENFLTIVRKYLSADAPESQIDFYNIIHSLDFMPSSPVLMNSSNRSGQLFACFVLPVEDSVKEIFETNSLAAKIYQSGGGVGMSMSRLRSKGSSTSSGYDSSGPIPFMLVPAATIESIKQGGARKGAAMVSLRVDHPDILDFIKCKETDTTKLFSNFNISIAITDKFWEAFQQNKEYELIDPHTKDVKNKLNAREVFENIVQQAHKTGDPGIFFIDRINAANPTPHIGDIESCNPCLTGDSLVATEKGWLPIEDLADKYYEGSIRVWSRNGIPKYHLSTMLRAFCTGKKEVFEIITKKGFNIRATSNHPFFTKDGWVQVSDLNPGDSVLVGNPQGANIFGSDFLSEPVMHSSKNRMNREYSSKFPNVWNFGLGFTLGAVIGGGFISDGTEKGGSKQVTYVFDEDEDALIKETKYFLDQMCFKYNEDYRGKGTCKITVSSSILFDNFKLLGVTTEKATKKRVPKEIFQAPRNTVKGFLRALFSCSGTVNENPKRNHHVVRLASSSIQLLRDVQLLLLSFGIRGRIHKLKETEHENFSYINVAGEEKIYESHEGYILIIDGHYLPKFHDSISFVGDKKDRLDTVILNAKKWYNNDKRFEEDEIVRITPVGQEKVYDITVPETHSFIANGFVVHNCGEVFLLPHEACNLGSINLSNFVEEGTNTFNFHRLGEVVHTAVHFLDNVLDANNYPDSRIEEISVANRKIGLGVMGFADCLAKMQFSYDSQEALDLAESVMSKITFEARKESIELARVRGMFPNCDKNILLKRLNWNYVELPELLECYGIRNALLTAIAPTGSISLICQCSNGIEPIIATEYERKDGTGTYVVTNKVYESAKEEGWYDSRYFKTALDIDPIHHVRIVAAFQKYTDNSISKTVNLPEDTPVETVRDIYEMSYDLNCKCVTVFRDKSLDTQVMTPLDIKRGPRNRPYLLKGVTTCVPLTQGKLYLTLNNDKHGLREVIVNIGKGGTEVSASAEATGRMLSNQCKWWVPAESIISSLKNIHGTPSWVDGDMYKSIYDAIARELEKFHNISVDKDILLCEKCQSPNVQRAGSKCYTCIDCGHSSCT